MFLWYTGGYTLATGRGLYLCYFIHIAHSHWSTPIITLMYCMSIVHTNARQIITCQYGRYHFTGYKRLLPLHLHLV